jgi:hypothetical protein
MMTKIETTAIVTTVLADSFVKLHGYDAANLMTALDAAQVPSEQDWDAGTTTWTLDDGSSIVIDGPEVSVFGN